MTLKLFPLIEYYGTLFWKNHAENLHQKLVPELLLILVNNPK